MFCIHNSLKEPLPAQFTDIVPVIGMSDHVRLELTSEYEALLTDTTQELTNVLEVHAGI